MMRFANRYSVITWLLLIVYFILHEYNASYGLVSFLITGTLLLRYALIGVILFFTSFIFLRSYRKSALFTFILIVFFLFFGAIHDTLKSALPGALPVSYTFIFSLIAIVAGLAFFIIKMRPAFTNVFLPFASLFTLILVAWQIAYLLFNLFTGKDKENNLALPVREKFVAGTRPFVKPDIFYIIFDSYAGSGSLARDFGFSNTELDSMLMQRNFFTAHKSISNYPLTPFSVSSILNMNYLDPELYDKTASAALMLKGVETVYKSQLPALLRKEGYQVRNYSVFDLQDNPASGSPLFRLLSERLIDEQTLWGRFKRDLIWNFTLRKPGFGTVTVTKALLKQRKDYTDDFVFYNIAGLESMASIKSGSPLFAYGHIMLPHSPYYFDASGHFLPDTTMLVRGNPRERFIEQTGYANLIIKQILDTIMKDRVRPYVIIIQGDHGFREFTDPADKKKIFENLNTFYFSDGDYSLLYDSISSVNTFRVVCNKYFGQHYKMLPDSSVYIRDPSFDFESK